MVASNHAMMQESFRRSSPSQKIVTVSACPRYLTEATIGTHMNADKTEVKNSGQERHGPTACDAAAERLHKRQVRCSCAIEPDRLLPSHYTSARKCSDDFCDLVPHLVHFFTWFRSGRGTPNAMQNLGK